MSCKNFSLIQFDCIKLPIRCTLNLVAIPSRDVLQISLSSGSNFKSSLILKVRLEKKLMLQIVMILAKISIINKKIRITMFSCFTETMFQPIRRKTLPLLFFQKLTITQKNQHSVPSKTGHYLFWFIEKLSMGHNKGCHREFL